MRLLKFSVALLFVGFCAQAALAQCCCSGAQVTITNGAFPLEKSEVAIKEVFVGADSNRVSFGSENEASFRFRVGCGNGKETLEIEYMGVVMRVRFKLHGDFGSPKGEIAFAAGDHVAEFAKESEDEGGRKLIFRAATAEEMKEIEPEPAADAPVDQTANPL